MDKILNGVANMTSLEKLVAISLYSMMMILREKLKF